MFQRIVIRLEKILIFVVSILLCFWFSQAKAILPSCDSVETENLKNPYINCLPLPLCDSITDDDLFIKKKSCNLNLSDCSTPIAAGEIPGKSCYTSTDVCKTCNDNDYCFVKRTCDQLSTCNPDNDRQEKKDNNGNKVRKNGQTVYENVVTIESDCEEKGYCYVKKTTDKVFNAYYRTVPAPGTNCVGYLPHCTELKPSSQISTNFPGYPEIVNINITETEQATCIQDSTALSKTYCSNLNTNGALKYLTTGFTPAENECWLKSCPYLKIEELKQINKNYDFSSAQNTNKAFCSPYKWKTDNSSGLFSLPSANTRKFIKCYESFSKEQLKYLILKRTANNISNTGFSCILHECPPISGSTLNFSKCSDDSITLNERFLLDPAFEINYTTRLLGGFEIEKICNRSTEISNCPRRISTQTVCDKNKKIDGETNDLLEVITINGINISAQKTSFTLAGGPVIELIQRSDLGRKVLRFTPGINYTGITTFKIGISNETTLHQKTDIPMSITTKRNNTGLSITSTLKIASDPPSTPGGVNTTIQSKDFDITKNTFFDMAASCDQCMGVDNVLLTDYNDTLPEGEKILNDEGKIFDTLDQQGVIKVSKNTKCIQSYGIEHPYQNNCTIQNQCTSTIDCGVDTTAHSEYVTMSACEPSRTEPDTIDHFNSWFYRPTPLDKVFNGSGRRADDYLTFKYNGTSEDDETDNICYSRSSDQGNDDLSDSPFAHHKRIGLIFGAELDLGLYGGFGCFGGSCGANDGMGSASPPACDQGKLGINGTGREYACGQAGYICNRIDMDSAYIRGTPAVNWAEVNEPDDIEVKIKACVRFKNTGALGACGKRECRIDCFMDCCDYQWCGNDKCATITMRNGEDCGSLDTVNDDSNCTARITGDWGGGGAQALRIRGRQYGRRFCVFLDASTTGCPFNAGDVNGRRRGDLFNDTGPLDNSSLFDDNTLTDHDGNKKITDTDVFGEKLFNRIARDSPSNKKFKINNRRGTRNLDFSDTLTGMTGDWITWDVIQYIGNNQPDTSEHCNLDDEGDGTGDTAGDVKKCRGFYDKEGNFFREQQCFTVSLPTTPSKFYEIGTRMNMSELFLPILYVDGAKSFDPYAGPLSSPTSGMLSTKKVNTTSFFTPTLRLKYGDSTVTETIPFENVSIGPTEITTSWNNDSQPIEVYKIKKISTLLEGVKPKVCLYKTYTDAQGTETDLVVSCLKRQKPSIYSLVLALDPATTYNNARIKAYFSKSFTINLSDTITINATDFSLFNYKETPTAVPISYLSDNQLGQSQGYYIFAAKSTCSKLYSECIDNVEKLYKALTGDPDHKNKLASYRRTQSSCDSLRKICKILTGTPDPISQVQKQPLAYSYEADNEICIIRGFEDYLLDIVAYNLPNDIQGKCILDNESKKKSDCRYSTKKLYCEEKDVDGCSCPANKPDCSCDNGITCIKTITCNCSGTDCENTPKECFKGGYNRAESVFINNDDGDLEKDISCKCLEKPSDHNDTKQLISRKETPREAGLCLNIPKPPVCEAVDYKNESDKYENHGVSLSEANIGNSHKWRTIQRMLGESTVFDLGHAEFPYALASMGNISGECKGFWRNKNNSIIPKATCVEQPEGNYLFEIDQNTVCERHVCERIITNDPNYNNEYAINYSTSNEIKQYESVADKSELELNQNNIDPRGESHGYALWPTHTKTTDGVDDTPNDSVEGIRAINCITGYGPAGSNNQLEKFAPVIANYITDELTDISITITQNEIAKKLIGITRNDTGSYFYQNDTNFDLIDLKENLPTRYCNQKGRWTQVKDLYNKGSTSTNAYTYYVGHSNHNTNENILLRDYEKNKYCERLYCPAISNMILPSDEDATPENIRTLGNNTEIYPDLNTINKFTFWRHAGGARWLETPASKKTRSLGLEIQGDCQENENFYNYDTQFYESFALQQTNGLIKTETTSTSPTRYCNHLGLWTPVKNKCVKSCGAIENATEDTGYAKWRKVLSTYADELDLGKQANWTDGNGVVVGSCDADDPDLSYIISKDGRPYRKCSIDGVWESVERSCVEFKTCPKEWSFTETEYDIEPSYYSTYWNGGEASINDITPNNTVIITGKPGEGYSGTAKRTCNIQTGEWKTPTSLCQPITCPTFNGTAVLVDNEGIIILENNNREALTLSGIIVPSQNKRYAVGESGLLSQDTELTIGCNSSNYYGSDITIACKLDPNDDSTGIWTVNSEVAYNCMKGCRDDAVKSPNDDTNFASANKLYEQESSEIFRGWCSHNTITGNDQHTLPEATCGEKGIWKTEYPCLKFCESAPTGGNANWQMNGIKPPGYSFQADSCKSGYDNYYDATNNRYGRKRFFVYKYLPISPVCTCSNYNLTNCTCTDNFLTIRHTDIANIVDRNSSPPLARCTDDGTWDITNSCMPLRNCFSPVEIDGMAGPVLHNDNNHLYLRFTTDMNAGQCGPGKRFYMAYYLNEKLLENKSGLPTNTEIEAYIADFCGEEANECDQYYHYAICNDGKWYHYKEETYRTEDNPCWIQHKATTTLPTRNDRVCTGEIGATCDISEKLDYESPTIEFKDTSDIFHIWNKKAGHKFHIETNFFKKPL